MMRRWRARIRFLFLSAFIVFGASPARPDPSGQNDPLVLMDFKDKSLTKTLPGRVKLRIKSWKSNAEDPSQWCELSFSEAYDHDHYTMALKVDYNIASHMTTYVLPEEQITSQEVGFHAEAYCGFYMALENLDVSRYKYLIFYAKGDQNKGYTRKFKMEIKDTKRSSSIYLDGLTSSWQKFVVPIQQFAPTVNLKDIIMIGFVFDRIVTLPKGVIFFDKFYCSNSQDDLPVPAPEEAQRQASENTIEELGKQFNFDVRKEDENFILTTHILFDTAKHNIKDSEVEKLNHMGKVIRENPNFLIEVHGHTDIRLGDQYNILLSQRRANEAKEFLIRKEMIDARKLSSYGWGFHKPVATNKTVEGMAQNRRVEFHFKPMYSYLIVKAKSVPRIDGSLEEWAEIKSIDLNHENHIEYGEAGSDEDLSAKARFQWDEQFLYFAVRVFDDEKVYLNAGKDIYQSDSVELFIDPDNNGFFWEDANDYQLGFSASGPSKQPQAWAWLQDKEPSKDEARFAARAVKDGVQIEAAISWEFLNCYPVQGMRMGGSVALNDLDRKSPSALSKLNWHFKKDERDEKRFLLGSFKIVEK